MSVTGVVRKGVVILPPGTALADGTDVRVETLPEPAAEHGGEFLEIVKRLAKDRPHLPADYALNHGHYTRGKRRNEARLCGRIRVKDDTLTLSQPRRIVSLPSVTTEWVLAEFGDAYSSDPKDRSDFVALYRSILRDPKIRIVPSDSTLFNRGVELFEARLDKSGP